MSANQLRRGIFVALIVSLLLHFIIPISFLYIESNKTDSNKNHDNLSLEQKKEDALKWAARKAHANQFGAPVIFKDEPEETIQEQINQTEPTDQDIPKTEQLTQATKQEEPKQSQELSLLEKQEERQKIAVQQVKNIANKLTTHYMSPKQPKQRPAQPKKRPHLPSPQQKPLTLAQLTKGFLEHIKDEGKDRITMIGQKGGTPTAEQLKHERYIEKLSWCLQNSFKINRDKFPVTEPVKTTVRVFLALNQNGTVKELGIVESSGNRLLDQFTHYIFRDASSSFPPVPQYLPHNPYKIIYIIEINTMHDMRIGLHLL
ncbi:MAG TPA: hypothetical protein ENI08_02035 [Candidatus Dependentiae bacterium]|nr:hypothetical protein [Candidatus Dependentiae bacterium]